MSLDAAARCDLSGCAEADLLRPPKLASTITKKADREPARGRVVERPRRDGAGDRRPLRARSEAAPYCAPPHPRAQPAPAHLAAPSSPNRTVLPALIRDGNLALVLGDLLRHRRAALLHPLRAADDPDPVGDHRRPGREGHRRPRLLPRLHLRARHGAHLRRRRRRLRSGLQAGPASVLPEALDRRPVRAAVRRAGVRHVRRLHAAAAERPADAAHQREQPAEVRHVCRHVHHGRAVGAGRDRLRRPGSHRCTVRHQPDRPDRPRRRRSLRHRPRHGRSAAARRRIRRHRCCRRSARGWTR